MKHLQRSPAMANGGYPTWNSMTMMAAQPALERSSTWPNNPSIAGMPPCQARSGLDMSSGRIPAQRAACATPSAYSGDLMHASISSTSAGTGAGGAYAAHAWHGQQTCVGATAEACAGGFDAASLRNPAGCQSRTADAPQLSAAVPHGCGGASYVAAHPRHAAQQVPQQAQQTPQFPHHPQQRHQWQHSPLPRKVPVEHVLTARHTSATEDTTAAGRGPPMPAPPVLSPKAGPAGGSKGVSWLSSPTFIGNPQDVSQHEIPAPHGVATAAVQHTSSSSASSRDVLASPTVEHRPQPAQREAFPSAKQHDIFHQSKQHDPSHQSKQHEVFPQSSQPSSFHHPNQPELFQNAKDRASSQQPRHSEPPQSQPRRHEPPQQPKPHGGKDRRQSRSARTHSQPPLTEATPVVAPKEEVDYEKKNSEYLRTEKRRLERKVQILEQRVQDLEASRDLMREQAQRDLQFADSGGLEINSLRQQNEALMQLKDNLYAENVKLERRLETAQSAQVEDSKQAACVICMDNLANLVCLPCKHLALCMYCGAEQGMTTCPICRGDIEERMQIFTP